MRCLLTLIIIGAALPLQSQWATAQQRPPAFDLFRVGERVRIRTSTHGLHVGRVERLAADTVYLHREVGARWVALSAVERLWVRGAATKKGALVGGITGAALGAASFAFISVAICDAAECRVDLETTMVGLATGALFGAISGAVIGSLAGEWRPRYP